MVVTIKSFEAKVYFGIVLTIHNVALPLHFLFCPKQGRYYTKTADLLIFMLQQLKSEFDREEINLTTIPLTLDSGYVSQELRERPGHLGLIHIIMAGKGRYVFTIDDQKWDAATWKKVLMLEGDKWGIDVPSCRTWSYSPTCGSLVLFFFRKHTTRSYYLMNFDQVALRGAEIWHIWKQHHVIECFWRIMKSIFHIRSMQRQGDGLYTALLIKVTLGVELTLLAYLLALRLQAQGIFSKSTITEIMRKLRREDDLRDFLETHFHAPVSTT